MTTLADLPFVTDEDITDRAMEAIHGGRAITSALARFVAALDDNQYHPNVREALAGQHGPASLKVVWAHSIDPAIGWEALAVARAHTGPYGRYDSYEHPQIKAKLLYEAEAMVSWPIYRAAILPQVYVNISDEDGGADVTVTRGEAEVIVQNWDSIHDGHAAMENGYLIEDLQAMREKLSAVADPAYRDRLIADIDEVINDFEKEA